MFESIFTESSTATLSIRGCCNMIWVIEKNTIK